MIQGVGATRGLRWVQRGLATPFLGLGGWCLLAPGTVERLSLQPAFVVDTVASHVLVGAFGAQAMLCGLLILIGRFSRQDFLVFGQVASLPFMVFNAYYVWVEPVFTAWMLLDFVGNAAILSLCMVGAAIAPPRRS